MADALTPDALELLTVRTADLESGALAEVGLCPLHGAVGASKHRHTFLGAAPGWVWVFLVLGLFPVLLARALARPRAKGLLHRCELCRVERRKRRRLLAIAWALPLLWIGTFTLSASNDALVAALTIAWCGLLLVALVATFVVMRQGLQGYVSRGGLYVDLGVAPAFVEACRSRRLVAAEPGA